MDGMYIRLKRSTLDSIGEQLVVENFESLVRTLKRVKTEAQVSQIGSLLKEIQISENKDDKSKDDSKGQINEPKPQESELPTKNTSKQAESIDLSKKETEEKEKETVEVKAESNKSEVKTVDDKKSVTFLDLGALENAVPGRHVLLLTKRMDVYRKNLRREQLNKKISQYREDFFNNDSDGTGNLYEVKIVDRQTDFIDSLPKVNQIADDYLVILPNLEEYVVPGEAENDESDNESVDSNHPDNPENSYPEDDSDSEQSHGAEFTSRSALSEEDYSDDDHRKKQSRFQMELEDEYEFDQERSSENEDEEFSEDEQRNHKIRDLFFRLKKKEELKKKKHNEYEGVDFDALKETIYRNVDFNRL